MRLFFDMIKSGQKTVEGRIAKCKYKILHVGDTLAFKSDQQLLKTKIVELKYFSCFEEMLEFFGVDSCLPGLVSMPEAINLYYSIPNYKEQESKCGVIGIKIDLFDKED